MDQEELTGYRLPELMKMKTSGPIEKALSDGHVLEAGARTQKTGKRRFNQAWLSPIILTPTMIAIIVFVYVFIGITVWVSLSKWGTLRMNMDLRDPFGFTYLQMFAMPRWHANLRNVVIFTVLFLTLSMSLGLVLALLIDRRLIGHTILRNIFLFPYALSFIVTGFACCWIFNLETGLNLLFDGLGINNLITSLVGQPLKPGWTPVPTWTFSL